MLLCEPSPEYSGEDVNKPVERSDAEIFPVAKPEVRPQVEEQIVEVVRRRVHVQPFQKVIPVLKSGEGHGG